MPGMRRFRQAADVARKRILLFVRATFFPWARRMLARALRRYSDELQAVAARFRQMRSIEEMSWLAVESLYLLAAYVVSRPLVWTLWGIGFAVGMREMTELEAYHAANSIVRPYNEQAYREREEQAKQDKLLPFVQRGAR